MPFSPHDPLLFTAARISTFEGERLLTGASGFFFARGPRLFLVTSRHVLFDEPTAHRPDRIEVELHVDPVDLTRSASVSLPLYAAGKSAWKQGSDSGGEVDVAVVELDRRRLPGNALLRTFSPAHLQGALEHVHAGSAALIVAFPLGFHDTVHHLPVVRQATVASSFGIRFQGQGCFLTDARMHRGSSGAPVVVHADDSGDALPWRLLGVHSARLDMANRDGEADESLGLNCAWYADMLLTLTEPATAAD